MKTTQVTTTVSGIAFKQFIENDKPVNKMTIYFNDEIACYKKVKDNDEFVKSTMTEIEEYRAVLVAKLCKLDNRFGLVYNKVKYMADAEARINALLLDATIEITQVELSKGETVQTRNGEYTAPRDVVVTSLTKIEFAGEVEEFLKGLRMNMLNSIKFD